MRTVQEIVFGVTGQLVYFDCPEGRPSSVESVQLFYWDATDDDATLATVLGRSPLSDLEIDGTMPAKPFLPLTRAEVTAAALRRGQLAAAALSTRAAELQLRTARGALLPRVDTYANWGASGTTLRERNGDHTIGIVASISLFDGGRYARIAESNAELARTRANERAGQLIADNHAGDDHDGRQRRRFEADRETLNDVGAMAGLRCPGN